MPTITEVTPTTDLTGFTKVIPKITEVTPTTDLTGFSTPVQQQLKTNFNNAVSTDGTGLGSMTVGIPGEKSFGQSITDIYHAVTGGDRNTKQTSNTPESLFNLPFKKDASIVTKVKNVAGFLFSASDADKEHILSQLDPKGTFFTDGKGNRFFIDSTGQKTIINKPGFSLNDASQLAASIPAFIGAGAVLPEAVGGAAAAALTFGIGDAINQGIGQLSGGRDKISPTEIGISALTGAGFHIMGMAASDALNSTAGKALTDKASQIVRDFGPNLEKNNIARANLVAAARDNNIPLNTTDVFPPKNIIGKMLNSPHELNKKIPITGTGDKVKLQQEQIQSLINDLHKKPQSIENQTKLLDLNNQLAKINEDIGKAHVEKPPTITNPKLDNNARNELTRVLTEQVPQNIIDEASQEVGVSLKKATFNEARQIVIKVRNKLSKISIGTNDSPKIKADINSTRSTISELDSVLSNTTALHDYVLPVLPKDSNLNQSQHNLINLSNAISSPGRTSTGQLGVTAKVHVNEVDAQKLGNVFLDKVDSSKVPGVVKTFISDADHNEVILNDLTPIVGKLPKETIDVMRESVLQTHASRIMADGGKMTGDKLLSILDTPAKLLFDGVETNRLKGVASLVDLIKDPKEAGFIGKIFKSAAEHKGYAVGAGILGGFAVQGVGAAVPALIGTLITGALSLVGKGFESSMATRGLVLLTETTSTVIKKQLLRKALRTVMNKILTPSVIKKLKNVIGSTTKNPTVLLHGYLKRFNKFQLNKIIKGIKNNKELSAVDSNNLITAVQIKINSLDKAAGLVVKNVSNKALKESAQTTINQDVKNVISDIVNNLDSHNIVDKVNSFMIENKLTRPTKSVNSMGNKLEDDFVKQITDISSDADSKTVRLKIKEVRKQITQKRILLSKQIEGNTHAGDYFDTTDIKIFNQQKQANIQLTKLDETLSNIESTKLPSTISTTQDVIKNNIISDLNNILLDNTESSVIKGKLKTVVKNIVKQFNITNTKSSFPVTENITKIINALEEMRLKTNNKQTIDMLDRNIRIIRGELLPKESNAKAAASISEAIKGIFLIPKDRLTGLTPVGMAFEGIQHKVFKFVNNMENKGNFIGKSSAEIQTLVRNQVKIALDQDRVINDNVRKFIMDDFDKNFASKLEDQLLVPANVRASTLISLSEIKTKIENIISKPENKSMDISKEMKTMAMVTSVKKDIQKLFDSITGNKDNNAIDNLTEILLGNKNPREQLVIESALGAVLKHIEQGKRFQIVIPIIDNILKKSISLDKVSTGIKQLIKIRDTASGKLFSGKNLKRIDVAIKKLKRIQSLKGK